MHKLSRISLNTYLRLPRTLRTASIAVAQLADNPYLAQETARAGIRRWYINRFRYSIFFTIEGEEIVILHIWHAARRWPWEREQGDE